MSDKSKYNVGETVWTPMICSHVYSPVQCTIEKINEYEGQNNYKMIQGCSFWRFEVDLYDNKTDTEKACELLNIKINEEISLEKKADEYWKIIRKGKSLGDGIYDVTDIPFYQIDDDKIKNHVDGIESFIETNPEYVIASAYDTYYIFILGKKPEKIKTSIGSGFNYGSTNIIQNCPKTILILAEND